MERVAATERAGNQSPRVTTSLGVLHFEVTLFHEMMLYIQQKLPFTNLNVKKREREDQLRKSFFLLLISKPLQTQIYMQMESSGLSSSAPSLN